MLEKYVLRNKNTASRVIDGQSVIMTLSDNTLHCLDEVGSRIWELCDGQRTLEDIVRIIHEEYMVDFEAGKTDCRTFVEELCAKGMLALLDKKAEE